MTNPVMEEVSHYGWTFPIDSSLLTTWGWLGFETLAPQYIPNHAERGVDLLVEQFRKDATNLIAALEIFGEQVQEVENVESDLITLRNVNTATGSNLDAIGEMVGLPRTSTDDEEYRADILTQIFINNSVATPETLISVVRDAIGSSDITYREIYPGAVEIYSNALTFTAETLARVQKVAPAGVRVIIIWLNTGLTPFRFGKDYTAGGVEAPANPGDGDSFGEWDTGTNDYYEVAGTPVGGQFVEAFQ
jgi:hypothetical protein